MRSQTLMARNAATPRVSNHEANRSRSRLAHRASRATSLAGGFFSAAPPVSAITDTATMRSMMPCDVVEVAFAFRQFRQPLAVADGLVRHREREMQAPIEIDLAAIGQRAAHRGGEFPQMIDLAVLDAADRRHRFDRGADHEARRGRALAVGAEAAAQASARPARAGWRRCRRGRRRLLRRAFNSLSRSRLVARLRVTNSSAISSSLEPK